MEWLNFNNVLNVITLLGVMFVVYNHFRDPDVNAKTEIELLKQSCRLKHLNVDENITMIKNNHLAHIEKDLADVQNTQTRILTILEERLPVNKNKL